jgi:hypothetical protein
MEKEVYLFLEDKSAPPAIALRMPVEIEPL